MRIERVQIIVEAVFKKAALVGISRKLKKYKALEHLRALAFFIHRQRARMDTLAFVIIHVVDFIRNRKNYRRAGDNLFIITKRFAFSAPAV